MIALMYGVLIISLLLQIINYLFFAYQFYRLKTQQNKNKHVSNFTLPLSIVICAKNAASLLQKNLPFVLEQIYPADWEVLVVDDASQDETAFILKEFSKKYPHLHIIKSEKNPYLKGKKNALAQGIAASSYDTLLLTDADCVPASPQWALKMVQPLRQQDINLVLGFAPYSGKKSLLTAWVHYETLLTAVQYGAWAAAGMPYMGVGRNIAYRKSFFSELTLQKYRQLASGDDDLLISSNAKGANTALVSTADSFCYSPAPPDFATWIQQKRRHLSTATHYTTAQQIRLAAFSFSQFLFYFSAFYILLNNSPIKKWIAAAVFFKIIFSAAIFYGIVRVFKFPPLSWLQLAFFEMAHLLYYIFFAPFLFFKQKKW